MTGVLYNIFELTSWLSQDTIKNLIKIFRQIGFKFMNCCGSILMIGSEQNVGVFFPRQDLKYWLLQPMNRISLYFTQACDHNHIHATLEFSVRIMVLFHKCERYFSSQHNTRVLGIKEIFTQHHIVISLMNNRRDESVAMHKNIDLTASLLTKSHSKDICPSLEQSISST